MKSIFQKIILLCATFLVYTNLIFAQNYLDLITESTCKCLLKIPDSISSEEVNLKLGICILEASSPYKNQLKSEHQIDLENSIESGEKLGGMIGLKMAVICPNSLLKLAAKTDEAEANKLVRGTITKIESDLFVIFSIKDEKGKTSKYFWLPFIDSQNELPLKYKTYLAKKVEISFTYQEFFDPKIEEYRAFAVISSFTLLP